MGIITPPTNDKRTTINTRAFAPSPAFSFFLNAAVLFALAVYVATRPPTVVRVCHEPGGGAPAAPAPGLPHQFLATPEQLSRVAAGNAATLVSLPAWAFAQPSALAPTPGSSSGPPPAGPFTAQDYEDVYAFDQFFFGLRGGVILESGALDGAQFSVSNFFVKALGWRAVHVEASPASYAKLQANRPESLNLNAAICTREEPLHWCGDGAAGGFWEFMSDTHRTAFWPNARVESMPAVPCRPLGPLLQLFGVLHVDLWILDVEGAELDVLRTVDLTKVTVDVVCIELDDTNPKKDDEVRAHMKAAGYTFWSHNIRNDWFLRPGFVPQTNRKGGAS